jgi:hypothetical protein
MSDLARQQSDFQRAILTGDDAIWAEIPQGTACTSRWAAANKTSPFERKQSDWERCMACNVSTRYGRWSIQPSYRCRSDSWALFSAR